MKILIDIGHPGDFYVFKNTCLLLREKGHRILFTVREGENETVHLRHYGFDFDSIGRKKSSFIGKLSGLLLFTARICLVSLKFRPDLYMSHGSMFAGYSARLFRKPHLALEDTGNMEQIRLSKPVSDVILSPDVLPLDFGPKHIRYRGYHELAYLRPEYFTANKDIYGFLKIPDGTPYAILRFVSWSASHDIGQKGLSAEDKITLVKMLSRKLQVFISSERNLDPDLEPYRISIPVTKMHDALAFATIYIGEGATMASEAGVLGIPSVYISSIRISYTEDQQKYGTVYNFSRLDDALETINLLLDSPEAREKVKHGRTHLLVDKIDVTAFFTWFIENYPESAEIMKQNPDFQNHFIGSFHS
ncbi:MAG: DUF354 domain-containing protein [Bacteroidales bacterium]|nr:DUF354 domain-containing protein [Bacteroidales bacterium]